MRGTRTLFVTGGTGLLGRRLVGLGAARGWQVVAPRRPSFDLRDSATVDAAAAAAAPDAVVHTAYAKADADELARVVVAGSAAVARAAAAVGARLVHLSSDVVFSGGPPDHPPYTEADPTEPVSDYGRAKLEAEGLVLAAVPGATVVRTSLLLGSPDDPGPQELLALDPTAAHWEDCIRQPCTAADLAAALLDLLDLDPATHDLAGPLHLAGPQAMTRAELAARVAGRPVRGVPTPPGIPLDLRLDLGRARSLLPRLPAVPA